MMGDNKRVIQRFFDDVFNAQSRAAAQELIAPNFVAHHPAFPDGIRGPEGIIQAVAFFRSAFPDLNYRVDAVVAEDELVAARWVAQGTHRGRFMHVDPTARRVSTTGIDMFRISGNQVVEAWVSSDLLGVLVQIGGLPAPARGLDTR